jgi:hypothetical protein
MLRDVLLGSRTATQSEIDAVWPGGVENDHARGRAAWTWCWAQLVRLQGRTEETNGTTRTDRERHQALAEAAQALPVSVRLSIGEKVAVYPKGLAACKFLDALKGGVRQLQQLQQLALSVDVDPVPDRPTLHAQMLAPLVEALAVQLWVWVITTPGPGLPFTVVQDAPEPPEWIGKLDDADLVMLALAHVRVHRDRPSLIAQLNPERTETALPLEGFVSQYAGDQGLRSLEIFEQWSLGELFSSAVSSALRYREAEEQAKAKARTGAR